MAEEKIEQCVIEIQGILNRLSTLETQSIEKTADIKNVKLNLKNLEDNKVATLMLTQANLAKRLIDSEDRAK